MIETYRPSGAVGILTPFWLAVAVAIGIGTAFIYQLLLAWIPFIYVAIVLTLAFGGALGGLGRLVVKRGVIRNSLVGILVGLTIATTAYSAKFWFQYEAAIYRAGVDVQKDLDLTPAEAREMVRAVMPFRKFIEIRVNQGWIVKQGAKISGIFVYGVWLIESTIVFGFAVAMPFSAAREPYSEKLGQWATAEETVMMLPVDNPELLLPIKNAQSVDDLLSIPIPRNDETNEFAEYKIFSIPDGELEDAYLSVHHVKISYDKEGNEKKNTDCLIKYALITSQQREQLRENAALLNEAISEYRKAKHAIQPPNLPADANGDPDRVDG